MERDRIEVDPSKTIIKTPVGPEVIHEKRVRQAIAEMEGEGCTHTWVIVIESAELAPDLDVREALAPLFGDEVDQVLKVREKTRAINSENTTFAAD